MLKIYPEENVLEVALTENNYTIKCETEDIGVPPGILKWFRNSHQENLLPSKKQKMTLVSHNFPTIKREDTGVYTCTAWNSIGRVSKTVLLKVLGKKGATYCKHLKDT